MSGIGLATVAHVYGGADGNPLAVSNSGNAGVQYNYDKVKNLGHYVLRTGVVRRLPDQTASWIMIFAEESNRGPVWWAGFGTDVPAINVGLPLLAGHPITIPCTNTNQISFIPEFDGDELYIIAGGTGNDNIQAPVADTTIDVIAPTIISSVPAAGATGVSRSQTVTLTASKALDPTTINSTNVTISPSVARTTSIDSNDATKILLIPTATLAPSTAYTVTVTTAVKGANALPFAAPFTLTFTTAAPPPPVDSTPPTVVSSVPSNNATSVNASTAPSITFSEPLSPSSVTSTAITMINITTGQPVSGISFSLSTDSKTVFLGGISLASGTDYQITVKGGATGVSDVAANHIVSDYTIFFTTAAPVAPASTSYNVVGNDYDVIYFSGGKSETSIKVANTSSKLYGKIPIKYVWTMYKYGPNNTPTGHSYLMWQRKDSSGKYTDFKTLKAIDNVTDLNTKDTTFTVNTASNTDAFKVGDLISIRYEGGDSNTNIHVKISNFDAFDGANTLNNKTTPKSSRPYTYTDYPSADLAFTIDFKA